MATHDYVLDNATGANFRADLNNALLAIVSNNSSSSEPSTKYAYQWWADTNEGVLKIRNSGNDGWVTLLQLDGTLTLEDGSASAPALGFRDDLNTGIFSSAADTLDVTCGGTTRGSFSSSGLTVTGNVTATTFVGDVDANNGDFDGTLEADAITVAGVALNTVIAGVASTLLTVNDESSDTTCFPLFVTAATGNQAPKSGTNLTFNSSNGTLTATAFSGDGSALTGVGGTTININADNRVITGSDSANTLEGEANFTYDGSKLQLNDASISQFVQSYAANNRVKTLAGSNFLQIITQNDVSLAFRYATDTGSGSEIARINNTGINFSSSNAAAESLDEYEEGSWTPAVATGTASGVGNARYVRIGRMVHVEGGITNLSNRTSTSGIEITGFPFALTFIENAKFAMSMSKFNQQSGGQGCVVDMLHNTSTAFPALQSNGNQGGPPIRHTDAHVSASSIIFSGTYTTG